MIDPTGILVTGGDGRLGRALAARGCIAMGHGALDILSEESIAAALDRARPRVLINCAGYTAVDAAEADAARAEAVNAEAAGRVAAACAKRDISVIQVSTDCVFGDGTPVLAVDPEADAAPLSVYGRTKYAGERQVLAAAPRALIARVSWLFDDSAETFVGKILAAGRARDALSVVDDEVGRPTPVGDLADTLIRAAERMVAGADLPSVLQFGPPDAVSRFEWARQIFAESAALGGPVPVLSPVPASAFATAARRPRGLVLDVSAAEALFGRMPDWRLASAAAVRAVLARVR